MKLFKNDKCKTCNYEEILECNYPCNLCTYNPRRENKWEEKAK